MENIRKMKRVEFLNFYEEREEKESGFSFRGFKKYETKRKNSFLVSKNR